jgi:hypothetical protein
MFPRRCERPEEKALAVPDWSREEFLTIAEVAGVLKLNEQTIRNSI